ncbi:MAG: hypothetical protein AAF335_04240 [Bacteroidota bacterium]
MPTKLHGRATTTPAIRKAIQENKKDTHIALAKRYKHRYRLLGPK